MLFDQLLIFWCMYFVAVSKCDNYSMLLGVDDEKHELNIGIIDFMRQYTLDKCVETFVKSLGILGGLNNTPLGISEMVLNLVEGDHMYFYLTGHGYQAYKRAPKAIKSSDNELIFGKFLSFLSYYVTYIAPL